MLQSLFPCVGILFLLSTINMPAQELPFIRQPALHPSGDTLAFSYQGDIWIMALPEGRPARLTIHQAYESGARFSPDGRHLAFHGERFGNNDLFLLPLSGGLPQRVTYHPADDQLSAWTAQNELLFSTERAYQQIEWDAELYRVSAEGGTPERLLPALGEQVSQSPDGRYYAFVRGACRLSRENYQGPADKEIWLYDSQSKEYRQLTDNQGNDWLPRWSGNRELYYLSSQNGHYALLRYNLAVSDAEPEVLVADAQEGLRYFDVHNGHLVYLQGRRLYWQKAQGQAQEITFALPLDYRFYPRERKTYRGDASDYALSPNEKLVALEIHGEIFVKELDEEKSISRNVSQHPYRDREPLWLNDSTLWFRSDRSVGQYTLLEVTSSDANKPSLAHSLKRAVREHYALSGELSQLTLSPDRSRLALLHAGRQLIVAEIEEGGALGDTVHLLDAWHGANGLAWSPDGRYLAYHFDDLHFNSEVYIQPIDGSRVPANVSMHPGNDYGAEWSPDGSKLAFISDRNGQDADLWFAWLREEDWLKDEAERTEGYYFASAEAPEGSKDEDTEKDEKGVEPVVIDWEGLAERLNQVTRMSGNEAQVKINPDGETFFFTAYNPVKKGRDLYSIKYDGSDLSAITERGLNPQNLQWDRKGESLFFLAKGKLHQMKTKTAKITAFPHEATLHIDRQAERQQVFAEAWREMEQNFYDPSFHGENWQGLREKYQPWALAASTEQDFRYAFNLMLGRLNASHLGLYGSNPEALQSDPVMRLGLEFRRNGSQLEISRVVPRSPADRPLNRLQVGDRLLQVNGAPVEPSDNFFRALAEGSEKTLLLQVEREGEELEVAIRPSGSLSRELYEEWVRERKTLTEAYSQGRLGYIHVRGMDMGSFERFERELMASAYGKEGLIIDVRFNGGGWTTDYLLAVLSVRQHAYTVPRGATDDLTNDHPRFAGYYPFSERLPLSGWTKPAAALCNQNSYSNAEIFSHAFKNLQLGPLVGMPTFGAVISTGGTRLLNGSYLRLPFRGWYVKRTGENMENGPAVPDHLVENPPHFRTLGQDPQLQKAVEVLLRDIDNRN